MKLPTLTLLLVSATGKALADKKIFYSCQTAHGKTEGKGGLVRNDFAKPIIDNMPTWSDHKYVAEHNRFWKDMVVVHCRDKAESKDKALEAIAEQQKIVREKTLGDH